MDQRVLTDEERKAKDALGRKRLDRSDPNRWADAIEGALNRQSAHIIGLYILLGIVLAKTAFDLMAWGDYILTGH